MDRTVGRFIRMAEGKFSRPLEEGGILRGYRFSGAGRKDGDLDADLRSTGLRGDSKRCLSEGFVGRFYFSFDRIASDRRRHSGRRPNGDVFLSNDMVMARPGALPR